MQFLHPRAHANLTCRSDAMLTLSFSARTARMHARHPPRSSPPRRSQPNAPSSALLARVRVRAVARVDGLLLLVELLLLTVLLVLLRDRRRRSLVMFWVRLGLLRAHLHVALALVV